MQDNVREQIICQRIAEFSRTVPEPGFAVSIKVRASTCFCSEHCAPEAHRIIDEYLDANPLDPRVGRYLDHETGPEVLVYIAFATAGLVLVKETVSLAKAVLDLIVKIIEGRNEGLKTGDRSDAALTIEIRGVNAVGVLLEKPVARFEVGTTPAVGEIDALLNEAILEIARERVRNKEA